MEFLYKLSARVFWKILVLRAQWALKSRPYPPHTPRVAKRKTLIPHHLHEWRWWGKLNRPRYLLSIQGKI
jgi:hypothetical protein